MEPQKTPPKNTGSNDNLLSESSTDASNADSISSYDEDKKPAADPTGRKSSSARDSADGQRTRSDGRRLVQKGSLREDDLIAEKKLSKKSVTEKEMMTEEERRRERRAANRLSAFQSRLRRKVIIKDLQKTVAELSKDNAEQQRENQNLRKELECIRHENESLRAQCAAVSASKPPSSMPMQHASVGSNNINMHHIGSILGGGQGGNSTISRLIANIKTTGSLPIEAASLVAELAAIEERRDFFLDRATGESPAAAGFTLPFQELQTAPPLSTINSRDSTQHQDSRPIAHLQRLLGQSQQHQQPSGPQASNQNQGQQLELLLRMLLQNNNEFRNQNPEQHNH